MTFFKTFSRPINIRRRCNENILFFVSIRMTYVRLFTLTISHIAIPSTFSTKVFFYLDLAREMSLKQTMISYQALSYTLHTWASQWQFSVNGTTFFSYFFSMTAMYVNLNEHKLSECV